MGSPFYKKLLILNLQKMSPMMLCNRKTLNQICTEYLRQKLKLSFLNTKLEHKERFYFVKINYGLKTFVFYSPKFSLYFQLIIRNSIKQIRFGKSVVLKTLNNLALSNSKWKTITSIYVLNRFSGNLGYFP